MSDVQTATTTPLSGDGDGRLFSPKVVLGMILAGVFAFSAFVVLSTYAPDLQTGDNGRAHALSKSAVGYGGMVRLLRNLGEPVIVSRRDLSDEEPALIIFAPDRDVSREAYAKAAHLSSRTLVVLPEWRGGMDPKHPGWVAALEPMGPNAQIGLLKAIGLPKAATAVAKDTAPRRLIGAPDSPAEGMSIETGPIRNLQTISGPGLVPVLTDAQGRIVPARRMPTETYILADPDLINTMGLKDIRTAKAGVGFCRPFGTTVRIEARRRGDRLRRDAERLRPARAAC